jgi:hypothetical protein
MGESCRKPESNKNKVRYLSLPGGSPRKILSQSGQIGNRDGSRDGTQTLPHNATIGSPGTFHNAIFGDVMGESLVIAVTPSR